MWNRSCSPAIFFLSMACLPVAFAEEPRSPGKLPGISAEALADPKQAAAAADWLEAAYQGTQPPESVRMLVSILRGAQMGPQDGWFGPAETRYTWKWLTEQSGLPATTKAIPADKFRGSEIRFQSLDRDGDGRITAADLDWSDRSPWVQQSYLAQRLYRRMNTGGNGKLTREELDEFFKRASHGKEHLSVNDFRDALLRGGSGGFLPGDAPTTAVLVRGLFAGEIGSMNEGPHIGETAPDFTLKSSDGKTTHQLTKLTGSKPVVLILGNFTCGPFRSYYPEVEAVYQRHKDSANFVMVYVREAHPTDGWHMESNTKMGVSVKQPKTLEERGKVCDQFCQKLKPTIPVLVDEINDPIGHAYSGMPARMYIIDLEGKVAYKSGRGPFGFRVGEMEQALEMALLETEKKKTR